MRIVGIDLGITGKHKAVIADKVGQPLRSVMSFSTSLTELSALVTATQAGNGDGQVLVLMEPTGMAWFPVAVYLHRQGWTVYLVNSRQVADLRRYFKRYAKSDRIDARVLVKLPLISLETMQPFPLPDATAQACQRGCKQLNKLRKQSAAIQNRVQAIDRFAWPGLEQVFSTPFGVAAVWFRQHYYDPAQVVKAGVAGLRQAWQDDDLAEEVAGDWIEPLVALARELVILFGETSPFLDRSFLQAEVNRELTLLRLVEDLATQVQEEQIHPLYRQLHPSGHLETLLGVGPDGAAVYASFIGDAHRFPTLSQLRGWSGLVSRSSQSANSEASGLSITQAGQALIKKYAYLNANVARSFDPQIAAIYYDQMVNKNKHHDQAVCACATHLLGRIRAVLIEDRPYQLRDVDGTPLTKQEARKIVQARYTVPEEVRKRNNKHARQQREELRLEKKQQKERPASK